jgi:methyl-accepting chemotaxis protein
MSLLKALQKIKENEGEPNQYKNRILKKYEKELSTIVNFLQQQIKIMNLYETLNPSINSHEMNIENPYKLVLIQYDMQKTNNVLSKINRYVAMYKYKRLIKKANTKEVKDTLESLITSFSDEIKSIEDMIGDIRRSVVKALQKGNVDEAKELSASISLLERKKSFIETLNRTLNTIYTCTTKNAISSEYTEV